MDITNIKKRILEIEMCSKDNEKAHILEDQLKDDFIAHVITYAHDYLQGMAKAIQAVNDLDYERWYA